MNGCMHHETVVMRHKESVNEPGAPKNVDSQGFPYS